MNESALTDALAACDALAAPIDDPVLRERYQAARGGVLLRVAPEVGLRELAAAPARARFVAFDYRLEAGPPPEGSGMRDAVRALLAEAPTPRPPRLVGLALWAGLSFDEAGLPNLDGPERALALGHAMGGGVPAGWGEALSWIDAWTGGLDADRARLTLLTGRPEAPTDAASALALSIGTPEVRLRALFELAVRSADGADLAAAWADAARAARAEIAQDPIPDTSAALLAGVLAADERTEPRDEAEAALEQCLRHTQRDEHPEARLARWRVAALAAARLGGRRWSGALEQVAQDAVLRKAPGQRAQLIAELGGGLRWVRGDDDARSAALNALVDLGQKAQRPVVEALVLAEVARASATLPGRSALPWFGEVGKRLGAASDDPWAPALAPKVARLLAEVDVTAAAGPGERLASPLPRALWALVLLERRASA